MKPRKRRPKDLDIQKESCIYTGQSPHGAKVIAFLDNKDGEIIKLITWLIEYRVWQCENDERKKK